MEINNMKVIFKLDKWNGKGIKYYENGNKQYEGDI